MNTPPNIHHAYLYTGPKGSGKRAMIYKQASALLGCSLEKLETHPDFFSVAPEVGKKEIKVATIKIFTRHLAGAPVLSPQRIGVVYDMDALSLHAANALLKTLEEPQGKTIILGSARDRTKILDTILSRVIEVPVTLTDQIKETEEEQRAFEQACAFLKKTKHSRLLGLEKQYERKEVELILQALERELRQNMLRACGLFDMVTSSNTISKESEIPTSMWSMYFKVIDKCRNALAQNAAPKTVLENCILSLPQV